ncbi:MAG TPA: helix-turn-helix transcriptional regulator [Sphingobium sp.]|nr:helix-turn-helix transcriptional regulator [Sphingobium sp.]
MRKANYNDLQLTHRELQILDLIAQGFSAKEVAQAIAIAPRTVEGHIDTIRLKLHARNRAHMVAKAVAARMVVVDAHPAVPPLPLDSGQGADFYVDNQGEIDRMNQPLLTLVSGTSPATELHETSWARSG